MVCMSSSLLRFPLNYLMLLAHLLFAGRSSTAVKALVKKTSGHDLNSFYQRFASSTRPEVNVANKANMKHVEKSSRQFFNDL